MKLTIITNLFLPHVVGGYELGCLALAREAQAAGHEIRVLTSACIGRLRKREVPTGLDVRYVFNPIYHYECHISGVPGQDSLAAFGGIEPANVLALRSHLSEFKPDAIWVFNPLGLGPIGILETAVASGVPTTIHLMDHLDQTVIEHQIGFNLSARWVRVKSMMGAIACSEKTLIRNQLFGKFARSTVIANGVRLAERSESKVQDISLSFKLVYFGQIERHKGVIQLVEAVRKFKQRHKNQAVELHLIGSGSTTFHEELNAAIARHQLETTVILHGFCTPKELFEKLKGMHLAVFPLNPNEPFAYVVIEAIAAGLPIVVTREAGCAEFLPADYPYLLDDRDDVNELSAKLAHFISHQAEAMRWCELLKDCVYEQCDLGRVCVPRCIEFLSQEKRPMIESDFNNSVENILASWQSNRHLNSIQLCPPPRQPMGKRVERWVREKVPPSLRHKVKLRIRQLLRKAA